MRVLCITPNASIDRTLTVPGFAAGGVWRAEAVRATCGGKGINVARALVRLGVPALATGILAGESGRLAAGAAVAEGLDAVWTWVSGETRTCVIIVGDGGSTTVINEPGVRIGDAEWQRFAEAVAGSAAGCAAACISGSLPPGCPEGGLAKLIAAASDERRRPVWVDSSGRALAEAVTAAPHGIKINADEAAALFGRPVASPQQALTAAREIRGRGVERVAVTLGADGAVIATEGGSWHAEPPRIDPVNTVGSGDCFLAGLIAGFAADGTAATALRLATACGAANALSREAGHFPADELRLMLAGTRVLQLAD